MRPSPCQRRTLALVPLRDPGAGKSRLADRLDAGQRAALALAMVTDVVRALQDSAVDEIIVVASGAGAAETASWLGVAHVRDKAGTRHLDDSLAAAAGLSETDVDVLVVMADLPALRPCEVDVLLGAPADVVVASSRDGGTGGLLQRRGQRPAFAFGSGSAERHLAVARGRGRSCQLVDSPGFAQDVDTWEDLAALAGTVHLGPATAAVLDRALGTRRPIRSRR